MANLEKLSRGIGSISRGTLQGGLKKAALKFDGVLHPTRPFQLRVFLNAPDASPSTPTKDNPNYAGTYYFYGQGEMPEHFAVVRSDRPGYGHRLSFEVDLTKSLQGLPKDSGDIQLTLLGTDFHGNLVPLNELELEDVSVVVER